MPPKAHSHKNLQRRMRRTMNYGQLRMDNLTMPLSEMVVDYFDKHNPYDHLDIGYASKLARECCIDPTTLIVAMIYVDRLLRANKRYFTETAPEDIYLSALVIAAKFLQDGGMEEFIWNDEWAHCSSRSIQRVNELELAILTNIEWNLQISESEFKTTMDSVERWIALHSMKTRKFFTYNDLAVLVKQWDMYWTQLKLFFKFTGAISATYIGALYMAVFLSGLAQETNNGFTDLTTTNESVNVELPSLADSVPHNQGVNLSEPSFAQLDGNLVDLDTDVSQQTNSCISGVDYENLFKEYFPKRRYHLQPKTIDHLIEFESRGIECF